MRDVTREHLFDRWITEVVGKSGPYTDVRETFTEFSKKIADNGTVSDTVTGGS